MWAMVGHRSVAAASTWALAIAATAAGIPAPAFGQDGSAASQGSDADSLEAMRAELAQARAQIAEQQRRLDLLEQRLSGLAQTTQQIRDEVASAPPAPPQVAAASPSISVGEPPRDSDRAPTVAVLDQQGTVITRKGELIGELGIDYTRSDRNRAIFRGITFPQAVLIGIFDINENRQDILSASAGVRYGLTKRLELGVRVPFLYRADTLITAPIGGSTNNDDARTINNSTKGSGIGDIELTARYQLNDGGRNRPFLIANLQATVPTGRDAFSVNRVGGVATQSATGAGFWGITPGLTAILPSEPAVLFGTVGYTFNLARNVDTRLPPVQIDRLDPGDQISLAAGIGFSFNERTSVNLGYSHGWVLGTRTVLRTVDETTGAISSPPATLTSRDLQIGRLLLGVSHRFSRRLQVNWSIDAGLTEDAPDVRLALRVPVQF
jgi:uncharacterized coiled-coil protein SlyX